MPNLEMGKTSRDGKGSMHYENQYRVQADEALVLGEAVRLLMSCGFNITSSQDQRVDLAGPGMRSTKQNPILGASEIILSCSHAQPHQVQVEADLGGVRWMQKFLTWFPTLLFGGLVTVFLVIGLVTQWVIAVPLPREFPIGLVILGVLGVLPFQIIRPIAVRKIRQRTETAIDACLANADASVRLCE